MVLPLVVGVVAKLHHGEDEDADPAEQFHCAGDERAEQETDFPRTDSGNFSQRLVNIILHIPNFVETIEK